MKKRTAGETIKNVESGVNITAQDLKTQAGTGSRLFTPVSKTTHLFTAKPYKVARDLYFTMELNESVVVADTKVRYALHTLHNREKRNVLFKTKIIKGELKVWRVL